MDRDRGPTSRLGKRSGFRSRPKSEGGPKEERTYLLDDADLDPGDDLEPSWNNNYRPRAKCVAEDQLVSQVGRPPTKPPSDQCVEAEIQPDDTLTSVSLKYNVPVAELKRVNRLLNDKDFYARKSIKIPVKPASLLTEILPGIERPNLIEKSKKKKWTTVNKPFGEDPALLDLESGESSEGTPPKSTTPEFHRAQRLLNQIDSNVRNITQKQEGKDNRASSVKLDGVNVIPSNLLKEDSSFLDKLNTNKKWISFYVLILCMAAFFIYLLENYERQVLAHNSHGALKKTV